MKHKKLFPRSSSVADKPGIYAWYYDYTNFIDILNLSLSRSDVEKAFLNELEFVSSKIKLPTVSGKVTGKFNSEYKCTIENIDFLKEEVYGQKIVNVNFDQLKQALYVLQNFSAPLYIGKAVDQSLRKRYLQHIDDFTKAQAGIKKDKNTFGKRLFDSGLHPRQLMFKYYILENRKYEIDMIEHIINRINKPTLGER